MTTRAKGKLIIIGGHEEKNGGDRAILETVAREVHRLKTKLLLATVASSVPEELAESYREVFGELGVKQIDVLDIRDRREAYEEENVRKLHGAEVVFFTGGDQLRITSQVGDSPIYQHMMSVFQQGGTIVGTSAGAAAMPETMLVSGPSDETNAVGDLHMAPGLGLIQGMVIDSHFAQRGRIGRLLGAVAQNPKNLGIGIDEDTAIVVEHGKRFKVVGSGAVYVVDGSQIAFSSFSQEHTDGIVSIYDLRLHVLAEDYLFDLVERQPVIPEPEKT